MTQAAQKSIIRASRIARRFGRRRFGLSDLTLNVDAGSCVGLVGPNGSGKTTLLKCVAGLLEVSAGELVVEAPGGIGFLPQDAGPPPGMSALEFLRYLARIQRVSEPVAEADRLVQAFDLAEWAAEPCARLSFGIRRRIVVAQAFLGSPALVLLDEPTVGLDPVAASSLRSMLRKLRGGKTLLLSSHDLRDIADVCTHVAFMQGGTVVECVDVETLAREASTEKQNGEADPTGWAALVPVIERKLGRRARASRRNRHDHRKPAAP